ncbi:MAG: hypothetical protein WBM97_12820 [Sedimenticolaceae bacterium]
MLALEHALISFFERVASRDQHLLSELERERCFAFTPDRWCFALPDLFSFLQQRFETVGAVSYSEFRRAIYAAPINSTIKHSGAEVVIDQNHGRVDRSVYALTWWKGDDAVLTPPPTSP